LLNRFEEICSSLSTDFWRTTRIAEEADLLVGPAFASSGFQYHPPGVRLVRGDNLSEGGFDWGDKTRYWPAVEGRLGRYLLAAGDVLVGMDGSKVGRKRALVSPSELPLLLVQRVARLRARSTMDSRFLYYLVCSRIFQSYVDRTRTGTAIPHISGDQIGAFRFLAPPVEEQQRIASLLGSLDDKIELNRRIAATALQLAHAIFRARYRGDDPALPHEPLSEHLDVVRGLSYTGGGLADDGVPLHNLNSIYEGGGYKRDGIKHYRGEYKPRHVVEEGDVIVANTEQGFEELLIACPAIVPRRFGDIGLFSHHLYRVRPKPSSPLSPHFVYLMLLPGRLRTEVAGYANGTTVNMLPVEALQKPRFAVPPRELVEEVDALVTPLFDRAEAAEDESETLAELRDTLLPKLISGEVRLRGDGEANVA
jgi:type I restriction enzyme S subunit